MTGPSGATRQLAHSVRFDWGRSGAAAIADGADLAVLVDVLTFGTALSVAAERGTVVLPHAGGPDAQAYATQHRAALGIDGSLPREPGPIDRLVLPWPDGAEIASDLGALATTVAGACLRNATAVADWIAREHDAESATIAIVAVGERWTDGSMRPAVEDLWGAGAVLAALEDHDWPGLSPEAAMAADAYRLVAGREASHLRACATGAEMLETGRSAELDVAAETATSTAVPLLSDRGFVSAP